MKSLSEQGVAIQRLDAPLPIWRASVDRLLELYPRA